MTKPIYLAYGSNLNKQQMKWRCPNAECLGKVMLPNYRLVFRGVADIIPAKGFHCPVGLWRITDDCEVSLDQYEGYPRLYRKEYFANKEGQQFMAYVMNRDGLAMPSKGYYDSIANGYDDFDIDLKYLEEALEFTQHYDSGDGYVPKRYR
jgi:gamma-glutamylcyclotransferase (GGCT)/AIG2-like uncharacterized protein YtfP